MATKCTHCPLRKLELFDPLSDEEVAFMTRFKTGELSVEAGTQILMDGSNSPQLFTVLSGMGLRYKTLEDGRRQIVNFVFPGDFLGLQAGIMGEMKHSVEASTKMTLCVFARSDIWSLFKNHPSRAYDMTWAAAAEEHFLGDTLASVGQRTAVERIAWAIVRLFERGRALSLTQGYRMSLPYRQQDLADALGLSLVHTNKTLSKLRQRQLVSWSDGELQIHKLEELEKIAMIDREKPVTRPLM
jgi:CRP-like cAMP-binding protein